MPKATWSDPFPALAIACVPVSAPSATFANVQSPGVPVARAHAAPDSP